MLFNNDKNENVDKELSYRRVMSSHFNNSLNINMLHVSTNLNLHVNQFNPDYIIGDRGTRIKLGLNINLATKYDRDSTRINVYNWEITTQHDLDRTRG